MIDSSALLVFMGLNLVVVVTPGPAVLYTVSRSISEGRRAGLLSVFGLTLGTLPHALAVAFGVAGLLASSGVAFEILRVAGAGYLMWLGIRRMQNPGFPSGAAGGGCRRPLRESFLVGVLNPKAILFFGALLPQFVDPAKGNPAIQVYFLWVVSQVMAVAVGSTYAVAAARIQRLFVGNSSFSVLANSVVGGVFIGLGVYAALVKVPGT